MSDDVAYIKLAKNIYKPVEAPWTYRILTPLLVYLLPFETVMGFIIVNISSLYATSILLFYYLRKLKIGFGPSIIGMLLFLLNPIILVLLITICVVDLLSYFLLLLVFYALSNKKNILFLVGVTVGVANREIILITLVLFFILKIEELNLISAIKTTLLFSISPFFVFFLIRFIYGFDSNYFSYNLILNVILIHIKTLQGNIFVHPYLLYLPFGIFWLISILNLHKVDNLYLKKSLYLIPFIFIQILIAENYSRLLFTGFPIIIPISLYMFKIDFSRRKIIFLIMLAIIFSIFHFVGVLYYMNLTIFVKLMEPKTYIYYALYVCLFDFFSIIILVYLFFRNRILEKKPKL